MSKNPLFRNGEENEKVIQNPQVHLNHHQKLITSRGSPFAHACQVCFRVHQLSCLQNDRQNDHITSALFVEVTTNSLFLQDSPGEPAPEQLAVLDFHVASRRYCSPTHPCRYCPQVHWLVAHNTACSFCRNHPS